MPTFDHQAQGQGSTTATILFADIQNYSQLSLFQKKTLRMQVEGEALAEVAAVIGKEPPLYWNTWGDAYLLVVQSVGSGVRAALALRDSFRNRTNWRDLGFDGPLAIRSSLHVGDIEQLALQDPFDGSVRPDVVGDNIDLAARIEPVTLPGRIWATEQVVSLLDSDQSVDGVEWTPLGSLPLAKNWPPRPLFDVTRANDKDLTPEQLSALATNPVADRLEELEAQNTTLRRTLAKLEPVSEAGDMLRGPNWWYLGEIAPDKQESEIAELALTRRQVEPDQQPVFVLYTGGTVGMVRSDPTDRKSQLTPRSMEAVLPHLKRISELGFDIHFWELQDGPLHGSNVCHKDWMKIAKIVQRAYKHYQGFVVLHGTDTMVYTASALSFIFKNLNKPVILTGAERPISEPVSDAEPNLVNALQIAAPRSTRLRLVPEVCIFFGTRLIRGNRAKKVHSLALQGFDSPNCELLGSTEAGIDIFQNVVHEPAEDDELTIARKLDPGVALFEVYPNDDACYLSLKNLVESPSIRGIILKTYGTGNAPDLPNPFSVLVKEAVERGKIIVNLTQCPRGQVQVRLFETNARLFQYGVINGGDMTPEAALCKLMWVLGEYAPPGQQMSVATVSQLMQLNVAGELRFSAYNHRETDMEAKPMHPAYSGQLRIDNLESDAISRAYIRVQGLTLPGTADEVRLDFYYHIPDLEADDDSEETRAHLIGTERHRWDGTTEITFNIEATSVVRDVTKRQRNKYHSIQVLQ